ncbi:ATP-binding cassette domain-containing protein [Mycobacterium sp.]|uniref:ATP-binding cassette domain-containing protein n=1 Tax=Mycobacterium sp. TaxID=1785 RepID=UPI003F94ED0B
MRYVFHPGRDVIVGYGSQCDIPLDRPGNRAAISQTARPVLVLRFSGSHWVAIDRSPDGIFVDGARMSTIDIRDGQAITIGDPQRGPRLVLGVGPAVGPPAPHRPDRPNQHAPTQQTTRRMRLPTPQPPPQPPKVERPLPPVASAPPTAPIPGPARERSESRGLIERMSTTKLRAIRPAPRSTEANTTSRLPLKPGEQPGARTAGVAAHWLGLTADGQQVLTSVSFTARPGTLTAVIGPSAELNSALLGLLAGTQEPSSGTVTVDEHDVRAERELMRTRIGILSRDDRAHPNLTVERAVGYAARLRLPPDTSPDHRNRVVDQVLDELGLTPQRRTRIRNLAPEMRRLASMAIELITRPTLLVVEELSAGLDATQEHHVLTMLRRQADLGCVVVVALTSQTSLTHLNMCDQVLLLAPAGRLAFAGPPSHIASVLGTADWSQVVAQVSADPHGAQAAALTAPPPVAEPAPPPVGLTVKQQIRVVARRQVRLLFANRVYFLSLVLLPFALAGLTLLIPGHSGLDRAGLKSANPHEAIEILAALNIAAVILGTALTIGDLVGQRRVFLREQSVGLATSAYVSAKLIVFSVVAAIQTGILSAIVIGVKGGPAHGAVVLHNPDVELYVTVAATAIVSAIVGLALSSLGNSLREVLPLVVPAILASLLFAGGLVPLVGTWGFDQISWIVPAQWGFAASGSTVDLHRVDALATNALTWTHYSGWWVFDMVMLLAFGAMWAGFVLFRLRSRVR